MGGALLARALYSGRAVAAAITLQKNQIIFICFSSFKCRVNGLPVLAFSH